MSGYVLDQELGEVDSLVDRMLDEVINDYASVMAYYLDEGAYEPSRFLDDDRINAFERQVESLCMQILLRERVFSGDLRKVLGNLKLVEDVERIGDQNWDILNVTQRLKGLKDETKVVPEFRPIVAVVTSMIKDALACYVKEDKALALDILSRDDIVDRDFEETLKAIAKLNSDHAISGENTVYQTLIVKYLERIADQATNIAEWVVYIIDGYHKDAKII